MHVGSGVGVHVTVGSGGVHVTVGDGVLVGVGTGSVVGGGVGTRRGGVVLGAGPLTIVGVPVGVLLGAGGEVVDDGTFVGTDTAGLGVLTGLSLITRSRSRFGSLTLGLADGVAVPGFTCCSVIEGDGALGLLFRGRARAWLGVLVGVGAVNRSATGGCPSRRLVSAGSAALVTGRCGAVSCDVAANVPETATNATTPLTSSPPRCGGPSCFGW